MGKESEKTPTAGAKEPTAESAHAAAKAAFEAAVKKTNEAAGERGEEEVIKVEAVGRKEPEPKPAPKPAPKKAEPDYKAELEAVKRELAALKERKPEPVKEEPKRPSDYESVQAELSEHFGAEEGEVLGKTLRALLEPREQRIAQLEDLIKKAVEQSKAQTAKAIRARIAKDYDHLSESDEAWSIVRTQADALLSTGKFDTAEEAYDHVVQSLYGAAKEQAEKDAEEETSRIAASTPTQPSAARREKKMTNDQKSFAIFEHLRKDPTDKAGAMRLARDLRVNN